MPEIDLYVRKSKVLAKGERLREVSTDEQLRQGRAWAARNGFTVRREWVELGSAYADKERPKFNAAVQALLNKEVPALWVYMLDRFTRKGAEDVLQIIGKARVIFDYDGLDSLDERDRERIIVEAERARAYSRRLSIRVRDVKASQRDAGEWVVGRPPYGMVVDPKTRKLLPDTETLAGGDCQLSRADLVRRMFADVRAGKSARQITRELNERGVPAPTGGKWFVSTVTRMIASPVYAGLQVIREERTGRTVLYRNEQGHTVSVGVGLVTVEEQDAAIKALKAPIPGPRARGRAKHLLTDITHCAHCGRGMVCQGRYYVCTSVSSGDRTCESPTYAGKKSLEEYVAARWLDVVTSLEPTDALAAVIAERWAALQAPKQTAEHRKALEALKAAEVVRERLQRAFRLGAYEGAEDLFAEEMKRATADVLAARDEVARSGAPTPDTSFVDDPDTARAAWEAADLPLRRELVRLAIDRVVVRRSGRRGQRFNGDERVTITWAAADD